MGMLWCRRNAVAVVFALKFIFLCEVFANPRHLHSVDELAEAQPNSYVVGILDVQDIEMEKWRLTFETYLTVQAGQPAVNFSTRALSYDELDDIVREASLTSEEDGNFVKTVQNKNVLMCCAIRR